MYVSIMCLCHPLIDSGIYGINRQHSMLAFHKENTVLLKKICHGMLPITMLAYLVVRNIFVSDVYLDDIANMKFQLHHSHLEQNFILKT